jgi:hypothetical protein
MLHGFDISGFQGTTAPTADFVFVKATEGSSYTNAKFTAQWASAKSHAKVRGAYHFARPEASSGASQADRLLAVAKAVPGEVLILDLEVSKLTQAQTNAWAKAFGDRLRARAPGVTTVVYMGSGYASNGTGRGLNQHFTWWWYPQYPSTARTSTWRTSFSPWLPGGLTCGWSKPHIWQFTDNFGGLDANISTLTVAQLAGGGPTPQPQQEEDEMKQRQLNPGMDGRSGLIIADKAHTTVEAFFDNSYTDGGQVKAFEPVKIRVTVEKSAGGWQTEHLTVGRGAKDSKQPRSKFALADKNSVAVSVTRESGDGTEPIVIAVY